MYGVYVIPIFGDEKSVRKKFMSIVTDSTDIDKPKSIDTALFQLYALFALGWKWVCVYIRIEICLIKVEAQIFKVKRARNKINRPQKSIFKRKNILFSILPKQTNKKLLS